MDGKLHDRQGRESTGYNSTYKKNKIFTLFVFCDWCLARGGATSERIEGELGQIVGNYFKDEILIKNGFSDWLEAFLYLKTKTTNTPLVLAIDEYCQRSWAGQGHREQVSFRADQLAFGGARSANNRR